MTSSSIWFTMRATGVVALALLSVTTCLGILTAGRAKTRTWPAFATAELHRWISLVTVCFVGVHVATAVIDAYVDVSWASLVVPFVSSYRPLWIGLGTVSLDLLAAVAISSALRQRLRPNTWRSIHWLAYASWPVAMAHSLGIGTDASEGWMVLVAIACALLVLGSLAWRLLAHARHTARARPLGATTRYAGTPSDVAAGQVNEHAR